MTSPAHRPEDARVARMARAARMARMARAGALLLAWAWSARAVPAQDADAAPGPPRPAQDAGASMGPPLAPGAADAAPEHRVVASLNGQAITSGDVAFYAQELTGQIGPHDQGLLDHVRRLLAEHLLLAGEAQRLGLKLTDHQVETFYKDLFGRPPVYDETAEIGVERQKELVRKTIEQQIYEMHRVGMWNIYAHLIPPDPVLVRLTTVTPGMIRTYFHDNQERYDRPPILAYTLWISAPENAESVRAALLAGETPEGPRPIREEIAEVNLDVAFADDEPMRDFLRHAAPGDVSETWIRQTRGGPVPVCIRFDERRPAAVAEFTPEIQAHLRGEIERNLRDAARIEMVQALLRDSRSVWLPEDLFGTGDEPASR